MSLSCLSLGPMKILLVRTSDPVYEGRINLVFATRLGYMVCYCVLSMTIIFS